MLGSLILYLKGMRAVMFQLSGFYYTKNQTAWTGFARAEAAIAPRLKFWVFAGAPNEPTFLGFLLVVMVSSYTSMKR